MPRLRIPVPALALALALAVLACDGATAPPRPASVLVDPDPGFIAEAGGTTRFSAIVRDEDGAVMAGQTVTWSTDDAGVATIDASGLATGVSTGTVTVTASAGNASGEATLEVWVAPVVDGYVVGQTYTGRNGYIEYTVGDLPIILSAPHGGDLAPAEIPDRTWGTTINDANTMELTHAVEAALMARTGGRPHVVVNRLRRIKLDANREVDEAAQGSPYAELAWDEFHAFLEDAGDIVTADHGAGLYLDMHGHGHDILRLELGYLLDEQDLALSDSALDAGAFATRTSIASLAASAGIPFSALLRGPTSLGTLLADRGVRAVPSSAEPDPGSDPYFTGGYDTRRHGSRSGGPIDGIQIEHHRVGLRDTEANRAAYAAILAEVLEVYMAEHYGATLGADALVAP